MTHSTPTASDLAALRWACLVDPFSNLPRLVLADALEEIGGEDYTYRAAHIRWYIERGGEDGCRADPDHDLSCPMDDDNGVTLRCSVCQALVDEGTPADLIGYGRYQIRRGFLDELRAPLGLILANLNVFRLHPITQVGAINKRPYAFSMPYEPTRYDWVKQNNPIADIMWHIPAEVFRRLSMGVANAYDNRTYTDPHDPAEDLSRAIVSLGREHVGLPPLRWPG